LLLDEDPDALEPPLAVAHAMHLIDAPARFAPGVAAYVFIPLDGDRLEPCDD
jgi:hypothetical protein